MDASTDQEEQSVDPDPATRNNMKLDDEVIDIESIEIPGTPGKKVKGKYKDLFIQKQLQLLANVKQKDSLAAAVDKPAAIRKLSNQSIKVKRLKNIQSDRQSRKARFDKRRALLGKVGKRPKTTKTKVSRSTSDDNPPAKAKRRYSTEVDKLGVRLPKMYRQVILSGHKAKPAPQLSQE